MLSGQDFSLVHVYAAAGTFTVTVSVADDDVATSATHTVTVNLPGAILAPALALIDELVASGALPRGIGDLLKVQIMAAQELLNRGKNTAAKALVRGVVLQLDLLVRLRVLTPAEAAPLRAFLVQAIASM
jgi:hypothetical protein